MKNKENNSKCGKKDKLSAQSTAFLEMLTKRGIVEDEKINDEKVRQAEKEKKVVPQHGATAPTLP